jgi:hypothetical protein
MVSRELFDEDGVRTCDMDELGERLAELQSWLQVLTDRARGGDDLDLHLALGAASRLLFGISRDLVEIDETLRQRGAIAELHA